MKWMMSSVAMLVAVVLSVTAIAQSGGTMARGDKMDKMEMKDTTHTGCVEAGSAPGTFMLTHLAADDHMGKDTMAPTTFSLERFGRPERARGPQGVRDRVVCARKDGRHGEGHDGEGHARVHGQIAEDGCGVLLVDRTTVRRGFVAGTEIGNGEGRFVECRLNL